MSFEVKLVFAGCLLAFIIPFTLMVIRRIRRGELRGKTGLGSFGALPPDPPSL